MNRSQNRNIAIRRLAWSRITRSIAAGMINVAFPYYILSELHHGAFTIGLIYMSATVSTAILGLLAGVAADIWGRRGTLIAASLLLPVSAAVVYLSESLWLIFLAAMIGGYSATGSLAGGGVGGMIQPIQSAALASLTPKEGRTRFFSVFTFVSGAAAAVGSLLVGFFDVRDVFLVAAVVSASGIPGLWNIEFTDVNGKIGRLNARGTIGKFTLTGMLNGFSQGLVIPFLIPFFVLAYHVPKSEISVYTFAGGMLGSLTILAAPFLERNLGFVKSMVVTRGIGILLFLVFPMIRYYPLSVIIYVLAPSFRVAALPIQQSELTRRVDESETGRALGINQVARLAASSTGTGLSGFFMGSALFEIPFFAYAFIMGLNLYLYLRFFGSGKLDGKDMEALPDEDIHSS
jgi:MFS family permease